MLCELEAEGGEGNIKQRFCVLSSHCLDRTPPRPNEAFVYLYQPLLLTHVQPHTLAYVTKHLGFVHPVRHFY